MFTRRSFSVVFVPKDDPVDSSLLVLSGHVRNSSKLARVLVLDTVHLLVVGVDGDVLQVSSVLEPRSSSRNVISCAFSLDLDQNSHVRQICSNPLVKWRQKLESVGAGGDVNNHAAAVLGWGLISVLARVESSDREAVTKRFGKFELRPVWTLDAVLGRVELQAPGQR